MKTSTLMIIAILSTLCFLIAKSSTIRKPNTNRLSYSRKKYLRKREIENDCNEIIQDDFIDLETIDSYIECLNCNF